MTIQLFNEFLELLPFVLLGVFGIALLDLALCGR